MKVLAPEPKALMTIFLSVGPVISTLLSSKPGPGGAHRQATSSLTFWVECRKCKCLPASSSAWTLSLLARSCLRVALNVRWRIVKNLRASGVRILEVASDEGESANGCGRWKSATSFEVPKGSYDSPRMDMPLGVCREDDIVMVLICSSSSCIALKSTSRERVVS